MTVIRRHIKTEVLNKLSLLTEVRSEGFEVAVRYKYGEELKYVESLKGKSNKELHEERKRLYQELPGELI